MDDWKDANATLRQMRRSAITWDYGPQSRVVEQKRQAYDAHRTTAHPDEEPSEAAAMRRIRPSQGTTILRPSVVRNVALGVALGVIVVLVVLLHSL
jgi:hypothetical protein